jgi:hypothetical protein
MFSFAYWYAGGGNEFNATLSRLDAVYFAVGTLSTAGTGSITAEHALARGLVTGQMVVDLVAIVVGVGLALSRLAEREDANR